MTPERLGKVLEAALLAAGRPLALDDFLALFEGADEAPDRAALRDALAALAASLDGRALELAEVASGYRLQVRQEYSPWLAGLFAERPPRYSRALLETLALIAYRQPITRGEIEDVRGVAVGTNIIKTLMEREWIRVLGHREVPGRPALYGTTRQFLDHFGLKSLDALPPLAELRDPDQVEPDLFASPPGASQARPAADEDGAGARRGVPDGDDGVPGERAVEAGENDAVPGDEAVEAGADDRVSDQDVVEGGEHDRVPGDEAVEAGAGHDAVTANDERGAGEDDAGTADDPREAAPAGAGGRDAS